MQLPSSWTIVHATPRALLGARRRRLREVDFAQGLLELPLSEKEGAVESAVLRTPFPFDELILSANATLPGKTSFFLEAQVLLGARSRRWSPWFGLGRFSPEGSRSESKNVKGVGAVDADTLVLERPAEAFRYRVRLRNEGSPEGPVLRLVAAALSDRRRPPRLGAAGGPGVRAPAGAPWVGGLDVPPRSQMAEDPALRGDICSPTALGMALAYWNCPVTTLQAARGVHDGARGIYGNWAFNVAYAGTFGLNAYVSRMDSPSELERELAEGRPVVVSVAFEKGELAGAPIARTRGHLILVRGFDASGDVVVNDPAAPTAAGVKRTYRRDEFLRAWLGRKRGVCYKISPRLPCLYKTAVPVAQLRKEPEPLPPFNPSRDPLQESQLVMGEGFLAREARGGWVRGEAIEQLRLPPGSLEQGYPGWVLADELCLEDRFLPGNAVVRAGWTQALRLNDKGRPENLRLGMGTRFAVFGAGTGPRFRVYLPGAGPVSLKRADVKRLAPRSNRPAGALLMRREIVRAAREFIGQRYFWGGRSSAALGPGRGVDCSGLVNLAYRAQGLDLPRDSHDQFLKSRRLKRAELRPGDLVFQSEPGNPSRVSHVMLYAGRGRVIEASGDADRVRELSLSGKLGVPLEEIEDGRPVQNRTLYCGAYLD